MKLHEAKMLRGDIAMTRMEWLCGEVESKPFRGDEGDRYITCVDVTVDPIANFRVPKGQPPERFDFLKGAYGSFEQVAMAQIVVMEWDKLKNGDKIKLDDEMQENIRKWGGSIWMGGSEVTVEKLDGGIQHLKAKKDIKRDRGHALIYSVDNQEF